MSEKKAQSGGIGTCQKHHSTTQKRGGGGGTLVDGYIQWLRGGDVSPGTLKLRISHVSRFAAKYDLLTASPEDVMEWLDNPKWSPTTMKSARSSLKSFYTWAVMNGRLESNPVNQTRPIKVQPGLPRPAEDDDILRALDRASDEDRLAILLGAYAGLRRAEIAGLHANDIGPVSIRVMGKGRKERFVPIHPKLREALEEARKRGGYLFPGGRKGQPIRPNAMGKRLSRALGDGISGHQLRHRFATRVYSTSKDLRSTQLLLGHSSIATTEVYVKVSNEMLLAAVLGS
jgi:integrase